MKKIQLHMPQSLYEELKRLASDSGKSFAAYMRDVLAEKMNERESEAIFSNKTP